MEIQKILFSAWASCLLIITGIAIAEYTIVSAARGSSSSHSRTSSLLYGNHILPTYNNNSASARSVFGISLFENKKSRAESTSLTKQFDRNHLQGITTSVRSERSDSATNGLQIRKGKVGVSKKSVVSRKLLPAFMKHNNLLETAKEKAPSSYTAQRRSRWQAKAAAAVIKGRKGAAAKGANGKSPMRPLARKGRARQTEKEAPLQNLKPIPAGVTIKPAAAHTAWHKARMKPIFTWPLDPAHFWVSSQFGMRKCAGKWALHAGVDLAAARGTPIRASAGGTVLKAAYSPGYGNYILIAHGKNFQTRYAHLDKILVRTGQKVNVGDYIGRVGATGFVRKSRRGSSGAHLHFEIYYKGKAMNPFKFLA